MLDRIQKMYESKKQYRQQMQRVQSLPEGYQFVFQKIQGYIWSFVGGDGLDMLQTQDALIDLFESGAAQGSHVLEITGEDVAGFCDGLVQGNQQWMDRQRNKLNRKMKRELEPGRDIPKGQE